MRPQENGSKWPWAIASAIGALTLAAHLPILWNGFVTWDDPTFVSNPALRSLDADLLRFAFGFQTPNWYPLTWIAHALDRALWGVRPAGHHATSLVLHAANAVLLFFVVQELLAARDRRRSPDAVAGEGGGESFRVAAAGAASLLFGIHPANVEAVAWASGKKDLLCTLFLLLAVRTYARYAARDGEPADAERRGGLDRHYLASVGWFALALLAKSSAVTFPAVLLLLDLYPFGRRRGGASMARLVAEKAPFLALGLAVSAVTYVAHDRFGDVGSLAAVGVGTRLLVSASATISYLVHLVWPVGLLPFYPYPEEVRIAMPAYLLPALGFIAISLACVLLARRRPALLAVWAYFLLTLVPVVGLVKMGIQAMADRYAYLPGIGPIILLGVGLAALARRAGSWGESRRLLAAVAGALAVASLSVLTVRLSRIWRDDFTLWNYEIETAPGLSWLAYQNRGVALSKAGLFQAALDDYVRAIAMNPRSPELLFNRGNAYARLGRLAEALDDYDAAIRLAGTPHPDYVANRSAVLEWLRRKGETAADGRPAEHAPESR